MRIEAEEDAAGNLLARLPGRGERSILLCAHLDTVDDGGIPIDPVIVDGGWENANDGILGADNKAAVAVHPRAGAALQRRGLAGRARAAVHHRRGERARGRQGSSTPRSCSPTSATSSTTRRRSARSSPRRRPTSASPPSSTAAPPTPASAPRPAARPSSPPPRRSPHMPLGRIDEQTTANVGSIQGGAGSTNIVPERCSLLAETRSLDPEPGRGRGRRASSTPSTTAPPTRSATSTSSPSACSSATARSRARPRSSPPRRRCAPAATSPSGSSPAAGRTRTCSRPAASRA